MGGAFTWSPSLGSENAGNMHRISSMHAMLLCSQSGLTLTSWYLASFVQWRGLLPSSKPQMSKALSHMRDRHCSLDILQENPQTLTRFSSFNWPFLHKGSEQGAMNHLEMTNSGLRQRMRYGKRAVFPNLKYLLSKHYGL